MSISVEDLARELDAIEAKEVNCRLNEVEFTSEGIVFFETGEVSELDNLGFQKLGEYFGVNKPYIRKSPPSLIAMNLEFWRKMYPDAMTRFYFWGDHLESVSDVDKVILDSKDFFLFLRECFSEGDEVVSFTIEPEKFFFDVTFGDSLLKVENIEGLVDELKFGVRVQLYPQTVEPVTVQRILYNESSSVTLAEYDENKFVSLKGKSVAEAMADVKEAVLKVHEETRSYREDVSKNSEREIRGSVSALLRQICKENNLSTRVAESVESAGIDLGDKENGVTVYDVAQVFGHVANLTSSFGTKLNLQYLGSDLLFKTDAMLQRCSHCEKLL